MFLLSRDHCCNCDVVWLQAVAELCLEHQQPGAAWQALAAWHAAAAAAGRLAHLPTILQLLLAAHTRLAADKSTAAAAERLTLLATVLHGCMPLWTEEQVDQQVGFELPSMSPCMIAVLLEP
jgi:hypothetical protein